MRITSLDWDEENILHILTRHNVNPEEVEEVCFSSACVVEKAGQNIYYITGQTESGRYLMTVLRFLGHGKARVITSRDMDLKEKSRHKKKMR